MTRRVPDEIRSDIFRSGPETGNRKRLTLLAASWAAILILMGGGGILSPAEQASPLSSTRGSEAGSAAFPSAAGPALTSVSLTFDIGSADQMVAAEALRSHGLRGTFFVTSGFVGAPGYMTQDDLHQLVGYGDEIGGHTVTLADLTKLEPDEAARQVCNDRTNLTDWGFKVTSFAYPFAGVNPAAEATVAGCGYNSARGQDTIRSRFNCGACSSSETVRPADAFNTKSPREVGNVWTLVDLKESVLAAEKTGGWLQLAFHNIDNSGSPRSITSSLFDQFTDWLANKTSQGTTAVRTVHEVIGGVAKPVVAGPSVAPAPPGVNALKNPGLENPGNFGLPACWQISSYGENSSVLSTLTPGHSGDVARRLDVSAYKSGDAKLLPVLDLGACAPSVTPAHTYSLRGWYNSTASTQFEVYYRTKVGTWTYWTASAWFPATTGYQQASWTTPPVPADAVAISFGLNLFSNGQLATDDYELYDTVGAPEMEGSR